MTGCVPAIPCARRWPAGQNSLRQVLRQARSLSWSTAIYRRPQRITATIYATSGYATSGQRTGPPIAGGPVPLRDSENGSLFLDGLGFAMLDARRNDEPSAAGFVPVGIAGGFIAREVIERDAVVGYLGGAISGLD